MARLESDVPLVHEESERLAQFLETLSAEDWQQPSACELWEIRDVVAHLIWGAEFYTDTVSRGLQGDTSLLGDRPPAIPRMPCPCQAILPRARFAAARH